MTLTLKDSKSFFIIINGNGHGSGSWYCSFRGILWNPSMMSCDSQRWSREWDVGQY